MAAERNQQFVYVLTGWEIDLARRQLRSRGSPVLLGSRAFEILAELAQAKGELLSKDELTRRVWRGVHVEDGALRVHMAAIRKAFGADRDLLSTSVGRGYRLLGQWNVRQADVAPGATASDTMQLASIPRSVPVVASELFGRSPAIARLRQLLSAYRTVTLVGPGGIGKTTLALEVARLAMPDLVAESATVELAALSDPALVPSVAASGLGVKLEGVEDTTAAIARTIGNRQFLLVIDNCEHVIDAAARLTETIINRCPGATVLATSREALRIRGEHVYSVPPLSVPPETVVSRDEALEHSAVQLFIARARAHGSDFVQNEDNIAAVAAICRRLDGIPLAIELAAARSVMLAPPKINALLDDRFQLLTKGWRTALPRHQTLRATLDWSYDLLTEEERRILRHLGIFAGEFSFDAAVAVAGGQAPDGVTSQLVNLVAKSLVVADTRGDLPYYRLLETTRAYALEKLHGSGEYRSAAHCHAKYYRDLFAEADAESESRPQAEWLSVFGRHVDNVRASLDWAFSPDGDAQIGVALTAAAVPLWIQLSLLGECRERVELALAKLPDSEADAPRLRMQLSAALGWSLMYGVGRAREAGPAWTVALQLAERLHDRDYLLRALWGLCIDQFNNGAFRKALEFARRFSAVVADSGNMIDMMVADRLLATTLHYFGDQEEAHRCIARTMARLADMKSIPQAFRFRFDLRVSAGYFQARILWLLGRADQSLQVVERNIEEGRASGHALTFCSVLGQGACPLTFLAGDLDAAERHCELLIAHTERYPIRLWNVWGRAFRGVVKAKRGDAASGLRILREELERAGEARFLPRFLLLLGEMAQCLGMMGDVAQGLATVDETLARCEARDERWFEAELLRIKGELFLHDGEQRSVADAESHFTRALEVARQQGAVFWELRTAVSLARLMISRGREPDAHHVLTNACGKFTEGFAISDMRDAQAMIAQLSRH